MALPPSKLTLAQGLANDALDLLRADSEKLHQMTAVANAICLDLTHGKGDNIHQLAELISFMSRDQAEYTDHQITRFQADLDLLEVAQ